MPPPPKDKFEIKRYERYDAIDTDGIVSKSEIIKQGDIFINKYVPINPDSNQSEHKESPIIYKLKDPSIVDQVLISSSENSPTMIKVLFRQTRRPELGDKFSSRHG
jgi:DNA-directed RNA polymerase III subunit RPC2